MDTHFYFHFTVVYPEATDLLKPIYHPLPAEMFRVLMALGLPKI